MNKCGISALLQTYIFWVIFWLFAFTATPTSASGIVLLFPLYGLYLVIYFYKFALPPLVLSALASGFLLYRAKTKLPQKIIPLIANCSFLVIFIVVAQVYLLILVQMQLANLNPDCVNHTHLWASLISQESKPGHTTAFKDGKIYQWSFRESAFYLNTRAAQYDLRLEICKR